MKSGAGLLWLVILSVARGQSSLGRCDEIVDVEWRRITYGAKSFRFIRVAASAQTDSVWIITSEGNYAIAQYDPFARDWVKDPTQPEGAKLYWNGIAVDRAGNPAFIDNQSTIHWKKNGTWTTLDGCAWGVSFGGGGHIVKKDCRDEYIHRYDEAKGEWEQLGYFKADHLAVDAAGDPWIRVKTRHKSILKWDSASNEWRDMRLKMAEWITIGPGNQVYALAPPTKAGSFTIYHWNERKWIPVKGQMAEQIAAGEDGRLYIVEDGNIYESEPMTNKLKCVVKTTVENVQAELKRVEAQAKIYEDLLDKKEIELKQTQVILQQRDEEVSLLKSKLKIYTASDQGLQMRQLIKDKEKYALRLMIKTESEAKCQQQKAAIRMERTQCSWDFDNKLALCKAEAAKDVAMCKEQTSKCRMDAIQFEAQVTELAKNSAELMSTDFEEQSYQLDTLRDAYADKVSRLRQYEDKSCYQVSCKLAECINSCSFSNVCQ